MDQLEEGIQVLRGLLHQETTTFDGTYFQLRDARNEPRPVQAKIPIWVGGGGEQRTLKIAARYADAWNVPFISPDEFARKRDVLHRHCETVGRDPAEIRCAINVGLSWSDDDLEVQFGRMKDYVLPGVLRGTEQEIVDMVGRYVDAGADQVNIATRAPFDADALERLAMALGIG